MLQATLFKFGFSQTINHRETTISIVRIQPHFPNKEVQYNAAPYVLFTFCNNTNGPKSRNISNAAVFWLENKIFHFNLCVFIIISALLHLLHLLSLHKSLVSPSFIYTVFP